MKEKKSTLFERDPTKEPFRCLCWRVGPDCAGFHLVSTLLDFGIDVYLAGRQHEHESESNLKLDYAMVIDNIKSNDHLAVKVISELDKCKTSCPRCRNVIKRAQMILNYSDCIKKKEVLGVCSRCSALGRRNPSCEKCKEVAENFIIWKRNRLGLGEPPTSTVWLRRISETVKVLKEPDTKTRIYSEQDFYDKFRKSHSYTDKDISISVLDERKSREDLSEKPKQTFDKYEDKKVPRSSSFDKAILPGLTTDDKHFYETDFKAKSDTALHSKKYHKESSSDSNEDISDTQIQKQKMHKQGGKKTLSGMTLKSSLKQKSKPRMRSSVSQVDIERVKHKKLKKYHSLDTLLTSINKKEKKTKKNFVYLFPEELKKKPKTSSVPSKGSKKKTKSKFHDDEKSKKGFQSSAEDLARDDPLLEEWKKGQKSKLQREKDKTKQKSDGRDDKTGKGSKDRKDHGDDYTKLTKGKRGGSKIDQEETKDGQGSKKEKGGMSDKRSRDILKKLEGRDKNKDDANIRDGEKVKLKKSDRRNDKAGISQSKDIKDGKKKGRDGPTVDKEGVKLGKEKNEDDNAKKSKRKQGKEGDGKASKKDLSDDFKNKSKHATGKGGDTVGGNRGSLGETKNKGIGSKKLKPGISDLLMKQISAKRSSPDNVVKALVGVKNKGPVIKPKQSTPGTDVTALLRKIKRPVPEAEDFSSSGLVICDMKSESDHEFIVGDVITKIKPSTHDEKDNKMIPLLFKTVLKDEDLKLAEKSESEMSDPKQKNNKEDSSGVTHYALSDRRFIEMGWTMLPTEKVVRKMNVYRMRPAHPEFDWFEHNKHKKALYYDTGEKLAEFDEKGRGKWFYRSGRVALDYYQAEEVNAQQRFVIYGSGEIDERGRSRSVSVLAMFDYLGNGVVLDNSGKIRLKYNQTEGVILDRSLGPVSHWKWHTLNDPPVLQQVMIDTHLAHKDQEILQINSKSENNIRVENEEMLAIEFDNFIKEKSKKLAQTFKPFQIKMKALKINEYFSLKVLDQASVYLIYRDGTTNIKVNIGMVLDHKEIVDMDTADLGEVSNSIERFPARTESLEGIQRSVAQAQRCDAARVGLEQRLRPALPVASADRLTAALSKPLRRPLQLASSPNCPFLTRRRNLCPDLYYDNRIV